MDTSLAEEVQHTATTLQSDSFFFMSPYRSFTTSGCFARFSEPAVGGDDLDAVDFVAAVVGGLTSSSP